MGGVGVWSVVGILKSCYLADLGHGCVFELLIKGSGLALRMGSQAWLSILVWFGFGKGTGHSESRITATEKNMKDMATQKVYRQMPFVHFQQV